MRAIRRGDFSNSGEYSNGGLVVEKTSQLIQALLSGPTRETIGSNAILPDAIAVAFRDIIANQLG